MAPNVPYLGPRYSGEHRAGKILVDPAWAYVPPVRPNFRLNLDREESTSGPGIDVAEADRRRRAEFMLQQPQRYPGKRIELALRSGIAERHGVGPEQVLLGNGIMNLLTYVYSVYSAPGRDVVVPSPGFWPAYTYAMQRGMGLWMPQYEQVEDPTGVGRFSFPLDETLEVLRTARVCYLCNPNNPTGTYLPLAVLRRLVESAPSVLFVIDNAYGQYCARLLADELGTRPVYQLDDVMLVREGLPNVLVANTFSKAYALANHRVGYMVGSKELIGTLSAHMGPYDLSEINLAMAYYNFIEDGYVSTIVDAVLAYKRAYELLLEQFGVRHYGGYRNSILVSDISLGEAYEREGIAVRSMVYQEGIPNSVAHTFRVTIPSDPIGFDLLREVTQKILG